jgi:hypothetical protein
VELSIYEDERTIRMITKDQIKKRTKKSMELHLIYRLEICYSSSKQSKDYSPS